MNTQTITRTTIRDQLNALARQQRRELCGMCAGSASDPCRRCAHQRHRITVLHQHGRSSAAIAATVGLPAWRVEQIVEEELHGHQADPRETNADLLRPYLGDELVDVILAGPKNTTGNGWDFDRHGDWDLWVRLTLKLVDWNMRTVRDVLKGTHIPSRPLADRVVALQRSHRAETGEPLSSEILASRCGIKCGTYFDRLVGLRPSTTTKKNGRTYGGKLVPTISVDYACRIASAIGVPHHEIPGL